MTTRETVVTRILKSKEESERIINLLTEQNDNFEWILRNLGELKKRFPNKYIAVKKRSVIETDRNYKSLIEKLKRRHIELNEVTIEYITDKPIKLLL